MVSMSTFLPCHQCYCTGLSLAWGLNLQAAVCGIFLSLSPGVFSGYSSFLPSFISLMIQPTKKAQINVISPLSNLIAELSLRTKWHVTWHLHVISARCVAHYLHTIAPGPLERACWRQFAALWGYCKKSRIAPLSAIFFFFFFFLKYWINENHYQGIKSNMKNNVFLSSVACEANVNRILAAWRGWAEWSEAKFSMDVELVG